MQETEENPDVIINDSNIPKYLEILSDENEGEPISSPYEIPLPDLSDQSSCNSSKNNIVQNEDECNLNLEIRNQNEPLKERTLSSSSTVSEASVYCPKAQVPQDQQPEKTQQIENSNKLTQNMILKVALPNSKEDCSSNEKLLTQKQLQYPSADKLRQFCNTNANIENVLNFDGITSM